MIAAGIEGVGIMTSLYEHFKSISFCMVFICFHGLQVLQILFSMLYAQEPTTGLDASCALMLGQVLAKLAEEGSLLA